MAISLKSVKFDWINKTILIFFRDTLLFLIKKVLKTPNALVLKTTRTRVLDLLSFLEKHLLTQYRSLLDIIVYDRPSYKYRFIVVYNLLSPRFNSRLLVCSYSNETSPVPSVCALYATAD